MNNNDQLCAKINSSTCLEIPNSQHLKSLPNGSDLSKLVSSERCQFSSNIQLDASEKLILLEALNYKKESRSEARIQDMIYKVDKCFIEISDVHFVKKCLQLLFERYLERYSDRGVKLEDLKFYRGKLVMIKTLKNRI